MSCDRLLSRREVDLLKGKALRMLKSAERGLVERDYDIAAFMADQAVQLYLKSVIYEKEDAEELVKFAGEVIKFVNSIKGEGRA